MSDNIIEDKFIEWLSAINIDRPYIKRALTSKSYKNVDHKLKDSDTAFELATFGDALIRFCYAKMLFIDECDKLSKEIEKYVTDERFVTVIAKHYELLKFIQYDVNDSSIVCDYNYIKPLKTKGKNKKESPHKYIATAVEALIGAIYLETNNIQEIFDILDYWKTL